MKNEYVTSPKTVLGYRKNGLPIYPIAGGSEPAVEPVSETVTIPVPVEPEPVEPPVKTFTIEDIEKARKEERDKLYPQLENLKTLKDEVRSLTQKQEEEEAKRQKAIDDAEAARLEAERKAAEEEMSAKELVEKTRAEFEARLAEAEREREIERAATAKEREFLELRSFTIDLVNQAKSENRIAPELADLVTGNTQEEVLASLELIEAKSAEIAQNIKAAGLAARASMPGVSPAGRGATGPLDEAPGTKTYSVEDLKNMPMSEYAKVRQGLLGSAAAPNNRGMLG